MDKRYTTTGVLLVNNKILLAKRKGSLLDGLWEFPGGKNRYGETLEETLKREWKEELNLDIVVKDKFFTYKFVHKNTEYEMTAFWVECIEIEPKLSVHTDWSMVPVNQLINYEMPNSDSQIRTNIIEQFH